MEQNTTFSFRVLADFMAFVLPFLPTNLPMSLPPFLPFSPLLPFLYLSVFLPPL